MWEGLAFERLCLWHRAPIKRALQIGGVLTNMYAWRQPPRFSEIVAKAPDHLLASLPDFWFAAERNVNYKNL